VAECVKERFIPNCKATEELVKKGKPNLYRSLGYQKVEAPRFQDNLHEKVARMSAQTHRKYCWYTSPLEGEWSPGP